MKDFPRTQDDFKEMRRSAAQHQPDVESAIHGVFLVEEKIPVDFEEDEEPLDGGNSTPKSESIREDPDDPEVKRKREQFEK